jgi:membrane-bound lytic murein transglycosylase D
MAYSRAHAAGMWQFIESTGSLYGLRKDCWVDERRDFIKSTGAAIAYLKKLYTQFSDWHIAIGSYNCGEKCMAGALARAAQKDFWHLGLPPETMHYVPEFISAVIIAKNPDYLDVSQKPQDTFDLDTVTVSDCISLLAVADSLGVSLSEIKRLNPHILHWCTHPRNNVLLYLPHGTREKFLAAFDQSPGDFIVEWQSYKVRAKESLKCIACRLKVSAATVLSLNNLPPNCRLHAGQQLLLPLPENNADSRITSIANNEDDSGLPGAAGDRRVIRYKVKRGDRLASISRRFHVPRASLCKWNGLGRNQRLRRGMMLTIYKTVRKNVVATASGKHAQGGRHVVYYKIRKGDNLWNIAHCFNVPVKQLMALNEISLEETLVPGATLKVPVLEEM